MVFFHHVKIIKFAKSGPKDNGKQAIVSFFYGKEVTLKWNPDKWRWVDGYHFLNHNTEFGREAVINRCMGTSGVRNVLCKRERIKISWNWKDLHMDNSFALQVGAKPS